MTVRTPPTFLQAGSHTAENTRLAQMGVFGSPNGSFSGGISAVDPGHGVSRYTSTGVMLAVFENGTPNMSVNVAAGGCFIRGTESASQGVYHFFNDGIVNLSISAADATNNRKDLVVAQVRDSGYSGADDDARLFVVEGTAAAAPVDPTVPENCLVLARVNVDAGATSIANADIDDLRTYARPWNTAWGQVASEAKTGTQGPITSTAFVNVTNMDVTFTAPGSRRYRIEAHVVLESNTNTDQIVDVIIDDGSGTQLAGIAKKFFDNTEVSPVSILHFASPSAGSVTYRVRARTTSGGSFDILAGATAPRWITVEDIGPA